MFDVGDVAMEGDYDPDRRAAVRELFGRHDPVLAARARLFGVAAQYTWSLLFVGMDRLLRDSPDASFDYCHEAAQRWHWTRAKLEDPGLDAIIRQRSGTA